MLAILVSSASSGRTNERGWAETCCVVAYRVQPAGTYYRNQHFRTYFKLRHFHFLFWLTVKRMHTRKIEYNLFSSLNAAADSGAIQTAEQADSSE